MPKPKSSKPEQKTSTRPKRTRTRNQTKESPERVTQKEIPAKTTTPPKSKSKPKGATAAKQPKRRNNKPNTKTTQNEQTTEMAQSTTSSKERVTKSSPSRKRKPTVKAPPKQKRRGVGKGIGRDARPSTDLQTSSTNFSHHTTTKSTSTSNQPEVRYKIEIAKSNRSKCRISKKPIPTGSLRWVSHRRGVPMGYVLLQNVTPRMLRNAIAAHGSVLGIHGLEELEDGLSRKAMMILRRIAMQSGSGGKRKRGETGRSRRSAPSAGRVAANSKEEDGEVLGEEDEMVMVLASKTLEERLEEKLALAVAAGDVVDLDDDDDDKENREVPPNAVRSELTSSPPSQPDPIIQSPPRNKSQSSPVVDRKPDKNTEEVIEILESDDELPTRNPIPQANPSNRENDDVVSGPQRPPQKMDMIIVKHLPNIDEQQSPPPPPNNDDEALCLVQSISQQQDGSYQITVSACMNEFPGMKQFNSSQTQWRFAAGTTQKPSRNRSKVGRNPTEVMKYGASLVTTNKTKEEPPLKGLRFVVTGVTNEYQTPDLFQSYVKGIVEAAGGNVTTGISGKTNFLIAGDWHYNPFLNTEGPIEHGSKYKKAMTTDDCTVITLNQLWTMIHWRTSQLRETKTKKCEDGDDLPEGAV